MRTSIAVLAEALNRKQVLRLLETQKLYSQGLGLVDVALLAATRLTPHAQLWTRDKRLAQAAQKMGLAAKLGH
jgi:predicted nucleic acid-binding protein